MSRDVITPVHRSTIIERILEAIGKLGSKKGSSSKDILVYLQKSSKSIERNLALQVQRALKLAVIQGLIDQCGGRYKLSRRSVAIVVRPRSKPQPPAQSIQPPEAPQPPAPAPEPPSKKIEQQSSTTAERRSAGRRARTSRDSPVPQRRSSRRRKSTRRTEPPPEAKDNAKSSRRSRKKPNKRKNPRRK